MILFNNNVGDDELEAGMGLTTQDKPTDHTDKYITVSNGVDYYLQLCGFNDAGLEDMTLMMHAVDGSDTFAWYGCNCQGNDQDEKNCGLNCVEDTKNPLVQGTSADKGVYLSPNNGNKSYKDFDCINVKATSGKSLLSLIRYDCFTPSVTPTVTPTASPSLTPHYKPTLHPSFTPTIVPTVKPSTKVPTETPSFTPT